MNKPAVVMFPPKLKVLKNDKYNLQIDVSWGKESRLLEIDKEKYGMGAIIDLINEVLLDLSEKNPYDII